jgi:hypothetical protein
MIPSIRVPSKKVLLCWDPDLDPEGAPLQFHLTYEGPLYGSSRSNPRPDHKHELRQKFHKQLKRLWEIHPALSEGIHGDYVDYPEIDPMTPLKDGLAQRFVLGKYRFVPLVRAEASLLCSLEILFLRPDQPGSLISSADLDSRLKTLFDALKKPDELSQVGKYQVPGEDEDPFFCLLQDDKLISHVSVQTDTLLEPTSPGLGSNPSKNDARIVINIKTSPYAVTLGKGQEDGREQQNRMDRPHV